MANKEELDELLLSYHNNPDKSNNKCDITPENYMELIVQILENDNEIIGLGDFGDGKSEPKDYLTKMAKLVKLCLNEYPILIIPNILTVTGCRYRHTGKACDAISLMEIDELIENKLLGVYIINQGNIVTVDLKDDIGTLYDKYAYCEHLILHLIYDD